MVDDPAGILTLMLNMYRDNLDFQYQIVTSEDDTDGPRFVKSRLTRFGFRCQHTDTERVACPWRSKTGMHVVWSPSDLSPTPNRILPTRDHTSFLTLATDIRNWCRDENIPLTSTLAGLANALLRDARFWPDARGRVPRATNENVRKYLPGVHSDLFGAPGNVYRAIALDQRRAYHVAATETPTPDPTTLFARGYFNEPETSPLWCLPTSELYQRTVRQPGLVYAQVEVKHRRKHQYRPPAVKEPGRYRCAIWTNELAYIETLGVRIEGLTAAWTSNLPDTGLPIYGEWAQGQLEAASENRRRWLKPTLHALYGLLAVRPRKLSIGHYRGGGKVATVARIGFGHEFPINNAELGSVTSTTTNVAMLGVLQSEIRKRTLELAGELSQNGFTVLHVHADGLHVDGDQLPILDNRWTVEGRTHLMYHDRVSWTSDEQQTLPGRDERTRHELRRRQARAILDAGKDMR